MTVKKFPAISDLSLYEAWNDAVRAGEIPLEDSATKEQFLYLGSFFVSACILSVKRGGSAHEWILDYRDEEDFLTEYATEGDRANLALQKARKPYHLD